MADDIREYLKAAQAAEVRGDAPQAIELLVKVATMYRGSGNVARALQMLRHAKRLDGTRADIDDALRRLEWMPDASIRLAAGDDEEERRALAPLEDFHSAAEEKRLIERGPTRAEPALAAWCSFCCRPKKEVGDLVAGPAGSFICGVCVDESARLLELNPRTANTDVAGAKLSSHPAALRASEGEGPECLGQESGRRTVENALRSGARWILLIGPAGSGKSLYLKDLERKGFGQRLTQIFDPSTKIPSGRLLVDAGERVDASGWQRLGDWSASSGHQLVVAMRGEDPQARISLQRGAEEHRICTSQELVEATHGALPREIAERFEVVALFERPSEPQLLQLAMRWLGERADAIGQPVLQLLAAEAARSGRGGHELRALLARIPDGEWSVKSAAPKKRRRPKEAP